MNSEVQRKTKVYSAFEHFCFDTHICESLVEEFVSGFNQLIPFKAIVWMHTILCNGIDCVCYIASICESVCECTLYCIHSAL